MNNPAHLCTIKAGYHVFHFPIQGALLLIPLSTFRGTTVLTGKAAFLIDEVGGLAVAAFLSLGNRAIGHISFQCPCHSIFPGVDGFVIQLKAIDQVYHIFYGHALSQGS